MNVASIDREALRTSATLPSARTKAELRLRFYMLSVLLDVLVIAASFGFSNVLRFEQVDHRAGITMFFLLTPLYLAIAGSANVYSSLSIKHWRETAWRVFSSFLKATATLLFILFFVKSSSEISRVGFAVGCALSLIALPLLRLGFHLFSSRIFGEAPFHVICISDGASADLSIPAQHIDAIEAGLTPDLQDPHALDRIGSALKHADRVIVYCEADRRLAWANALKGTDLHAEIVVPELQGLGSLGAGTYANMPTLAVAIPSLDMRARIMKRSLDLVVAGSALLVLAPLMVLVALAVKLDSPGSVLFVQPRLGRGNRLFPMYKFRSMRSENCDPQGAQSTLRSDSRITRVGRIIRATSIDELPQILNVMMGDMSIVGPRPHALGSLAGHKLFWEVDQRYWHRHATKPGITGLAQIRGFRGATHMQSDLIGRLQSDLEYLNGWSLWRDVSILFATFRVLWHKNAY